MTELASDLLREDTEKAKVLTATFASVVTSKSSPQEPWISEHRKLPQVPEWLSSLHPWRHWKPSLIRSWAARHLFQFSLLWAKVAGLQNHQRSIQTSSILSPFINKEIGRIAMKNIHLAKYQVLLISTDSLWKCNNENTEEQPLNTQHRLWETLLWRETFKDNIMC